MSQSIPPPSGNGPEGTRSSCKTCKTCKTCPSSSCHEGVLLLGVMTSSGRLAYLHPPTPVDADFVERATAQGSPERRFRFAGDCIEGDCPQWTGAGCGVADVAVDGMGSAARELAAASGSALPLPACSIRRSCRWFSQRGAAACAVCPLIVADLGGTETYQSIRAEAARD